MTMRDEMMSGRLYNAGDPGLLEELHKVQEKCQKYNLIPISHLDERDKAIREIIPDAGAGLYVVPPFFCDYGTNIEIGNNVFINCLCVILDEAKVRIGNNVYIAPQCAFYTAGHPLDADLRRMNLEYSLPITIGDDVWIGGHVCVMPGVTIGSGSVIGGGSVVVKDIPEGVLAAGNPCRVIRKLSPSDKDKYLRE